MNRISLFNIKFKNHFEISMHVSRKFLYVTAHKNEHSPTHSWLTYAYNLLSLMNLLRIEIEHILAWSVFVLFNSWKAGVFMTPVNKLTLLLWEIFVKEDSRFKKPQRVYCFNIFELKPLLKYDKYSVIESIKAAVTNLVWVLYINFLGRNGWFKASIPFLHMKWVCSNKTCVQHTPQTRT